MDQINSKQRVLAAVAHAETDRVPADFSANRFVLERLRKDLAVDDHRALLDHLNADMVDLRDAVHPTWRGPMPKERVDANGVRENYWGWRTRVVETAMGPEECFCEFPLREAQSVEELEAHRWPSVDWFDFSDFAERLRPWRDLAVMASGASVWQHVTFLRGMDTLLLDMACNPEITTYLLDRYTDFYVEYFDRMFSAADGQIDIFRIADDLATQESLLVSPRMFDTYIAPRLKRLIDLGHSHGLKVMLHSCGNIVPLLDRIVALGVDILDPIQVTAREMDPSILKSKWGDRLCFHGGIDTQRLLPNGSPEEVQLSVGDMMGIMAVGGGYILAPSHALETDVPTGNVLAMYAVDRKRGGRQSAANPA